MRKAVFLLVVLLLFLSTGAVLAYSGSHSFVSTTTTSDGHTYQSQYVAFGSFPYNGQGQSDKSRVNLKGTLSVISIDGVPSSDVYCLALKGSLTGQNAKVTATGFSDVSCGNAVESKTYQVVSYTEDQAGNFEAVARDSKGIISTISGQHQYTSN